MNAGLRGCCARGICGAVLAGMLATTAIAHAQALTAAAADRGDPRIRTVVYNADEVYRLRGYAGYQIDLQFAPDETFAGLAAGDMDGLSFNTEANHLFLKPKAATVRTNMTVLTSRHTYHFDYQSSAAEPDAAGGDVLYVLRFAYPQTPVAGVPSQALAADEIGRALDQAPLARARNYDYWYCGPAALRPVAAWDDGVHTWLRFAAHADLPALFVRNDDGSESLLNFSIAGGDVIVQRVARQFVLRRGRLQGCVTNRAFAGGGDRLRSGTVAPTVERATLDAAPSGNVAPAGRQP